MIQLPAISSVNRCFCSIRLQLLEGRFPLTNQVLRGMPFFPKSMVLFRNLREIVVTAPTDSLGKTRDSGRSQVGMFD